MMSDERLMSLCRALADTVRSGLLLSEAFEILSRSPNYGKFIAGAAQMAADGNSLHEALKAQKIFPPVFIALVRAGEEGGKVVEFLTLYADCLEVRIEFRRRLARTLVYPAFAVIIAGALLLFGAFKVLPIILGSFFTAGIAVPGQILRLSDLSGYLYKYWLPVIIVIGFAALALRTFLRSGPGRKICALAGHWLPVFSYATGEARLYHIYTTMGLLLKAGIVPGAMMDVLLEFSQDDPVTHRRFVRASALFSDGKSFSESLGRCIPPEDLHSLEIAEKAGRLDETLLRLGKNHYDRHSHRLKLLVTGCRISAMVTIALLSFGLVLLLMRPVLSVIAGVQGFSPPIHPPVLTTPSGQRPPSQTSPHAPRQLPNSYVVEDITALFNNTSGKKIIELIKKSSSQGRRISPVVPKPAEPRTGKQSGSKGHINPPAVPKPAEPDKTNTKKLGPTAPIRTIKFQMLDTNSIKPAPINPADIR
ncbi:MAG: type II secretion system F family protein [Elusimicrobia bacterium]|nr:type II secretion system F family protein [Elusimicrobiota bacterium]